MAGSPEQDLKAKTTAGAGVGLGKPELPKAQCGQLREFKVLSELSHMEDPTIL